jgi:hypothetical protein
MYHQMQITSFARQGLNIKDLASSYMALLSAANLKPSDKRASKESEQYGLDMIIKDIETYTPAEYFADKKVFADNDGFMNYFLRHIVRPFKNLRSGTREQDPEYSINDIAKDNQG